MADAPPSYEAVTSPGGETYHTPPSNISDFPSAAGSAATIAPTSSSYAANPYTLNSSRDAFAPVTASSMNAASSSGGMYSRNALLARTRCGGDVMAINLPSTFWQLVKPPRGKEDQECPWCIYTVCFPFTVLSTLFACLAGAAFDACMCATCQRHEDYECWETRLEPVDSCWDDGGNHDDCCTGYYGGYYGCYCHSTHNDGGCCDCNCNCCSEWCNACTPCEGDGCDAGCAGCWGFDNCCKDCFSCNDFGKGLENLCDVMCKPISAVPDCCGDCSC